MNATGKCMCLLLCASGLLCFMYTAYIHTSASCMYISQSSFGSCRFRYTARSVRLSRCALFLVVSPFLRKQKNSSLAQSGVRFSLTLYAAVVAAIIESNSNTFSAKDKANEFRCVCFSFSVFCVFLLESVVHEITNKIKNFQSEQIARLASERIPKIR